LLVVLNPITLPVALVALAHAWIIPELYAARGANVARPPRKPPRGPDRAANRDPDAEPEHGPDRVALGLLGDLLDHEPRALHARTGLVAERGELGVWLVGPVGALLVRHGGRRVHCYCVKASDPALPAADRIAHLLLALRTDEAGFATVANLAFSGARWRVRRRLPQVARPALSAAAVVAGRADRGPGARRAGARRAGDLRRRAFGRRRTDPA
jgi:hypothetical protein